MIINRIREARAAVDVVRDTKRTIQNAGGFRGSVRFGLGVKKSSYGDPVAEAMQIREKLRQKLAIQEKYAAECHDRMMEEVQKIPSAVTQQIFLRRYYDGCTWSVVAKRVGIGVQAAKMRHQRYLESEGGNHAA